MRKYRDNFDLGEEVFKNITNNFRQIAWYSMHRICDNLRINTTVTYGPGCWEGMKLFENITPPDNFHINTMIIYAP